MILILKSDSSEVRISKFSTKLLDPAIIFIELSGGKKQSIDENRVEFLVKNPIEIAFLLYSNHLI